MASETGSHTAQGASKQLCSSAKGPWASNPPAFTSQVLAHPGSIPTSCCFIMTSKKIPNTLLKSYKRITNNRCTLKAIVFKTRLGKEICADPKEKWVKNSINHLDKTSQTFILEPSCLGWEFQKLLRISPWSSPRAVWYLLWYLKRDVFNNLNKLA